MWRSNVLKRFEMKIQAIWTLILCQIINLSASIFPILFNRLLQYLVEMCGPGLLTFVGGGGGGGLVWHIAATIIHLIID